MQKIERNLSSKRYHIFPLFLLSSHSFFLFCLHVDIDVADALLKLPEEEEGPADQPELNPDDVWDETGLDQLSTEDTGHSSSASLMGTYLGHSARPYPSVAEPVPLSNSAETPNEP